MNIEIIGFLAGGCIALSLLPQLIKTIKTKSVNDLSILWLIINLMGQVLWLIYGLLMGGISLVVMSTITFVMTVSLLVMKIRFSTK